MGHLLEPNLQERRILVRIPLDTKDSAES